MQQEVHSHDGGIRAIMQMLYDPKSNVEYLKPKICNVCDNIRKNDNINEQHYFNICYLCNLQDEEANVERHTKSQQLLMGKGNGFQAG